MHALFVSETPRKDASCLHNAHFLIVFVSPPCVPLSFCPSLFVPCPTRRSSTFLSGTGTPAAVGPDAYNVGGTAPPSPSYPPFNSQAAREVMPNKTTSAMTPGPGSFLASDGPAAGGLAAVAAAAAADPRLSSGFASTATRSELVEKHHVEMPGPGEHVLPSSFGPQRPAVKGNTSARLQVQPLHNAVPSIPRRHQSHGYRADSTGKRMAPVPPRTAPVNPANPSLDGVKPAAKAAQFGKTTGRALTRLQEDLTPVSGLFCFCFFG